MARGLIDRALRMGEARQFKEYESRVDSINQVEPEMELLDDAELRAEADALRERARNGEPLDDLLSEAFALVREAARRTIGQRHFDVQLIGGMVLHSGAIAEMKTGEGKTLTATLPVFLNTLAGHAVHLVTVNDYLARRHAEWMAPIYEALGVTVSAIQEGDDPPTRRQKYACDVTYGTNSEFGFDYLRDNMALSLEDCVQRGHNFAIVDEVDSILIDEARTPLIISGPAEDSHKWYPEFAKLVNRLHRDEHYEVDEKKRTVAILEAGIDVVEDRLGIGNLYESANTPLISYLNNAIKAKELFKLDRDYVNLDGEILIVDEHTGRTLVGRRYNEGLHQAIEAKERVQIREEYQTLATITLQNYFRMYDKLSGMTGTALTEAAEFQKIYGLGVVPIPTNMDMIRADQRDLIYRTEEAKFEAIVADVVERHEKGQPVLIGTASVAKSEILSAMLKKAGVRHEVLNAKQHEREAAIIALAGRKGAVTVATNMAGRGTDIILGGNAEFLADHHLREKGIDPVEHSEEYEKLYPELLAELEEQVAAEHAEVVELGGLYVVGSERHESRRIDNQLRGRSGRQGDPGESRFYLSLGDDLMRLFKSDIVDWVLQALKMPDDVPIENKRVTASIASAQSQVEAQNFEIRKNLLKYDDVMNRQRHAVYGDRRKVLEGADVESRLRSTVDTVVEQYVIGATEGFAEDWDLEQLWTTMATLYPVSLERSDYEERDDLDRQVLIDDFKADAQAAYDRREAELGEEVMRELERRVLLTVLDRKWREHLYEMDYLREGIGLRAYAQKQPLVEYQREGYDLFAAMMEGIKEESVGLLFNLEVQVRPTPAEAGPEAAPAETAEKAPVVVAKGLVETRRPQQLQYTAPSVDGEAAVERRVERAGSSNGSVRSSGVEPSSGVEYGDVARNAPCPCGSGKKFKRCHGDPRH